MRSYWFGVIATYLHLIAMATYVGGSLIMELVVGHAQKSIPPAQAQVMGEKTADRFLLLAWSALGLLLVSGIMQAYAKSVEPMLMGDGLFDSGYGWSLFLMIALWAVLVVNGSIMTFVLRPRLKGKMGAQVGAAQVQARQGHLMKTVRQMQWITRADLVIALLVPLAGAGLLHGNGLFTTGVLAPLGLG
ncbi:MAG: CopD family protein [Acidimicrobiia bacterium]|nr:CopD family protein [Acidimicrobiia bacterium]MCL4291898.1 CopD family protein [Acidimicrobiia bacterium]